MKKTLEFAIHSLVKFSASEKKTVFTPFLSHSQIIGRFAFFLSLSKTVLCFGDYFDPLIRENRTQYNIANCFWLCWIVVLSLDSVQRMCSKDKSTLFFHFTTSMANLYFFIHKLFDAVTNALELLSFELVCCCFPGER